jgi:hypothetical protein
MARAPHHPHARTIARIIRFGSAWIPWGDDQADVAPGIDRLRHALSDAGRDPDQLDVRGELPIVSTPEGGVDLDGTMEPVSRLVKLGVTDFRFGLPRRQLDDLSGLVAAFRDTTGRSA